MSKEIDSQIKDIILSYYEKPYHFLKKIETGYPSSKAIFQFDCKQYTTSVRPTFSGTNSIILSSQVLIVVITANIYYKRIPELADIDLPISKVAEFAECLMISRYNNIAFKKAISRNQTEPYTFTITIDKVIHKPRKGLTFFKMSYELCNRRFTGKLTVTYNANRFSEKS